MKILMLGWELPPHIVGGMGVACYQLSKALAQKGSSIDFVVPYSAPHTNIDFMTVHNATKLSPLYKFGMGAYNTNLVKQIEEGSDVDAGLTIRDIQKQYVRFIGNLVARKNFDVIHAHDWLTMEAGIRAKELTDAPLIVHVHATEFDRAGGGRGNPIIHEIEYQGLLMADRILAVSNITKKIIVEKYGIPADKVEVVYNALDLASLDDRYVYNTKSFKYIEGLKAEGYTVVGAIGRLTVQKGLPHLLEGFAKAVQKYDRIALLLAGSGEQRDELIRFAADYGISDKVFIPGFVSGKQLRDAYGVSDICVLSSISEPFGLSALEAAYYNNAVIVTKQTGVGEVLNNVMRYDFWDTDKLADQLVGIATSPALKETLQNNVSEEYNCLSWNNIADTCMKHYASTTSPKEVYA